MTRHTKHYYRAAFLLIGGAVSFFVVRGFLVPDSFGEYGFYRGDNVEEQMNITERFAAKDACATCHGDVWATHQNGAHATVQCQNCHDTLPVHFDLENGEKVGPMPIQKSAQLCLRCHLALPSRPTTQPQITPETHLKDISDPKNPAVCFSCHSPHDPKGGSKHGAQKGH